MKSLITWNFIRDALGRQIPVTLLYVVDSRGSSPGRSGFSMAMNSDGETAGSLGGGIMEHKFVQLAGDRLHENATEITLHRQVHSKLSPTDQSGMICSGEQTMVLLPVSQVDGPVVDAIINSLEHFEKITLKLSPCGIQVTDAIEQDHLKALISKDPDRWEYREILGYKNRVSIIGGGHCALALSRLLRGLDFYLEVYEERSSLKTLEVNDAAHRKHILDNYGQLGDFLPEGPNEYVVIMTVGYRTDAVALRAILDKRFKYLGVLGSAAKIAIMKADLENEGHPADLIARLHAPVGLPIHSQTPEEVAVSIAAEIIGVKNAGSER